MSDQPSPVRSAVVLGGSLAGLLAARALVGFADRVTVVERDVLPDGPEPRRNLPQARHVHVLWSGGARAVEELAPGRRRVAARRRGTPAGGHDGHGRAGAAGLVQTVARVAPCVPVRQGPAGRHRPRARPGRRPHRTRRARRGVGPAGHRRGRHRGAVAGHRRQPPHTPRGPGRGRHRPRLAGPALAARTRPARTRPSATSTPGSRTPAGSTSRPNRPGTATRSSTSSPTRRRTAPAGRGPRAHRGRLLDRHPRRAPGAANPPRRRGASSASPARSCATR